MLTDKDFDKMADYMVSLYSRMEMELLLDIASRFKTYSSVSGSLEWYLKKLEDMNILNDAAVDIIAKYSSIAKSKIKEMITYAQLGNFDENEVNQAFNIGMTKLKYDDLVKNEVFKASIEKAYKEADETFKLINTKALESHNQTYMNVLNKAYIETSSGVYSYSQAIQRALEAMSDKGVTGATYRRKNGSLVHYSIESVVRRDTLTAVHQAANEATFDFVEEMGTDYVDVSSHLGARVSDTDPTANHAGWQGKQYKLHGSEPGYPNFAESTGYGDIKGFGGVNCRHRAFAFFPGISVPYAKKIDEKENRQYYFASQKQRKLEREMRSLKKKREIFKEVEDKDKVRELNKMIQEKSNQLDAFCDENDLKRDYSRERVY